MRTHTILICCLFALVCHHPLEGQGKRSEKLAQKVWGPEDKHGSDTEVPEKWQKFSAVVLYQEFLYDYDQSGQQFIFTNVVRQRIKLQDAAAVESYSELSFSPYALVGMRVQKPGGEVRTLDFSKSILAQGDHGDIRKMPVDDLSPGDILDYFISSQDVIIHSRDGFDPIISVLSGEYPIMEQKFVFLADKRFHFTFQSLNGAPEIRPMRDSDREIAYQLVDTDRAPQKPDRWTYRYREEPTLKFKMLFLNDKMSLATMRITSIYEKGEMSRAMSKQDVLDLSKSFLSPSLTDAALDREFRSRTFDSLQERMAFIYSYLRKKYITDEVLRLRVSSGTKIPNVADVGLFQVDFDFANRMSAYLRVWDIPYEVIVAMPASLGVIDDMLMVEEMVVMVRADFDTPVYYARPTMHTVPNQIPYLVDGTRAYAMKVDPKTGEPTTITTTELPITAFEENHTNRTIDVTFDDALENATIAIETKTTGYNREDYQNAFLQINEIFREDEERFTFESSGDKESKSEKAARERREENLARFKREDDVFRKEVMEGWMKDDLDFDIESYDTGQILSMGRFPGEDTLIIYEECTTNSMLSKAGKNYLVDAGKLIGNQVAIKEDETDRTAAIYMPFPRSFNNEMIIHVPEGYTAANLDKLQYNVVNSTGGFTSTAELTGNDILLKTSKYYIHDYEPADKWPEMVEFLNAAYEYTQQKILLKPLEGN